MFGLSATEWLTLTLTAITFNFFFTFIFIDHSWILAASGYLEHIELSVALIIFYAFYKLILSAGVDSAEEMVWDFATELCKAGGCLSSFAPYEKKRVKFAHDTITAEFESMASATKSAGPTMPIDATDYQADDLYEKATSYIDQVLSVSRISFCFGFVAGLLTLCTLLLGGDSLAGYIGFALGAAVGILDILAGHVGFALGTAVGVLLPPYPAWIIDLGLLAMPYAFILRPMYFNDTPQHARHLQRLKVEHAWDFDTELRRAGLWTPDVTHFSEHNVIKDTAKHHQSVRHQHEYNDYTVIRHDLVEKGK